MGLRWQDLEHENTTLSYKHIYIKMRTISYKVAGESWNRHPGSSIAVGHFLQITCLWM